MLSHLDQRVRSLTMFRPIVTVLIISSSRRKRKDNLLKECYQCRKHEHIELTLDNELNQQMADIIN